MLSAREGRGGGSLRIWNIRKATPWQGEFFEAGSSEGTKSRGGWWCCRRLDADVCCLKIHTAFRSSNTAPSAWVARLLLDSDLDLSDLGNVKRRHDASDVRWIKKKSKKEKKKKKEKASGHDVRPPSPRPASGKQGSAASCGQNTNAHYIKHPLVLFDQKSTRATASFTSLNKWVYKSSGCNSKEA